MSPARSPASSQSPGKTAERNTPSASAATTRNTPSMSRCQHFLFPHEEGEVFAVRRPPDRGRTSRAGRGPCTTDKSRPETRARLRIGAGGLGLPAVFRQQAQVDVRLGRIFAHQPGGIAAHLTAGRERRVVAEPIGDAAVRHAMIPAQRRRHVDDSSNEFGELHLRHGLPAPQELVAHQLTRRQPAGEPLARPWT